MLTAIAKIDLRNVQKGLAEVFEGGHVPAQNVAIPMMTRWFDETLGRVE